jgi:hypothetical protein
VSRQPEHAELNLPSHQIEYRLDTAMIGEIGALALKTLINTSRKNLPPRWTAEGSP